MKAITSLLAFLIIFIYFIGSAQPQIDLQPYKTEFNQPLGIVNADDERLFIVEQRGLIKIIDGNDLVLEIPFLDLSDVVSQSGSERGLLGLAFHPDYDENGYFFINYTRESDGNTVVARFYVDENNPDVAVRSSEQQLLEVEQPYANHNGGQLLFGSDGFLYIALGDGGSGGDPENNAQNLNSFLGKILRIETDTDEDAGYTIPADNPFVDEVTARDEIWAWGVRNSWRNSFDRLTGDFWIADVGQSAREEVNFQEAGSEGGLNYGWRCYEGNLPYYTDGCQEEANYVFPVYDYAHAESGCTGSITGGYVYRGSIHSELYGKYLFADYCTGNLYYISHTGEGFEGTLLGEYDAFEYTSFGEDMNGELYVAMRGAGEIRKVVETGDCRPVAMIKNADSQLVVDAGGSLVLEAMFHSSLEYQWNKNGVAIEGETGQQITVTAQGMYSVSVTNPENECSNTSDEIEVVSTSIISLTNENSEISVFPNPASEEFYIEELPLNKNIKVSLINANGKNVLEQQNYTKEKIRISTGSFTPGLYLLQINYESYIFHKKLIIQ